MKSTGLEFRVGLVVLAGLLVLVYMTIKLGDISFGKKDGHIVYFLVDSAAGLELKAPIKIAGVEIGKIEEIELEGKGAKVTGRVMPDTIRKGTLATVKSTGLIGEKYIELIQGDGPEFVKDGENIHQDKKSADVDALINQVSSIATDIKAVTKTLQNVLGTPEGEKSLANIVKNIEDFSENIRLLIAENRQATRTSINNIQSVTETLKKELPLIVSKINQITSNLNDVTKGIAQGEGTLGKLVRDEALYKKVDESASNINNITKKVNEGKGTLGKLVNEDAVYNDLKKALNTLGNAVAKLEKFKVIVGLQNEYQLDSGDNKGYFSLDVYPNNSKFYRVELVDDPSGKFSERTDTVTVSGTETETKVITSKSQIKFSALIGKRFDDFQLRVGMFENSFGVGGDYFFLKDKLKLSLDVWDFNSNNPISDSAHMKGKLSYLIHNNFKLHAGYDNPFNRKLDTVFIGGEFFFEDEDIKYILTNVPIPAR